MKTIDIAKTISPNIPSRYNVMKENSNADVENMHGCVKETFDAVCKGQQKQRMFPPQRKNVGV